MTIGISDAEITVCIMECNALNTERRKKMIRYTAVSDREARRKMSNKLVNGLLTEIMKTGDREKQSCFEVFYKEDYSSAKSCYQSFNRAIKRGGYPMIVMIRGGRVFLIRTDM